MSYDWAYSFLVLIIPLKILVVYLILKLFICQSSKHINLKGKHVFITGGSKGANCAQISCNMLTFRHRLRHGSGMHQAGCVGECFTLPEVRYHHLRRFRSSRAIEANWHPPAIS